MSPDERARALETILGFARAAADIVSGIYAQDFAVEYKGKDDPVTRADKEANDLLTREIARAYPGIPVVAEESDPASFAGFQASPMAWFVDPLDGTREFVAKNGEFAVMIGLAEEGRATLGVLVMPALGRIFLGAEGVGAFEVDAAGIRRPILVSSTKELREATVVVSRSHRHPDATPERLGVRTLLPVGSAGVKAAMVACGEADIYLQPGMAGKLWDSCGPEAIVRAAGGHVSDTLGRPLAYRGTELANANGFLVSNGALHDTVLRRFAAGP